MGRGRITATTASAAATPATRTAAHGDSAKPVQETTQSMAIEGVHSILIQKTDNGLVVQVVDGNMVSSIKCFDDAEGDGGYRGRSHSEGFKHVAELFKAMRRIDPGTVERVINMLDETAKRAKGV